MRVDERTLVVRVGCAGAAGEVVALVDGDDEERVVLGDPVVLQPLEERRECLVVARELLLVVGLARP